MRSRKLINVNSSDRTTGTDSKFAIKVSLPSQHRFNRICLVKAMLPKSWYTVQEGQNRLTLHEGETSTVVELLPANYNRKSLAVDLSEALTNASPHGYTYAISYPNAMIHGDDGKYVFSVDSHDLVVALEVPDQKTSNMFELLGFNPGSINTFTDGSLKSANVVKIQNEDTVRIHCNVCDNNGDDVLAEIYALSSPTFSNVVYECPDLLSCSRPLSNKTNAVFEFSLTNEANVPLSLNGLNYVFEILLFEEVDLSSKDLVEHAKRAGL